MIYLHWKSQVFSFYSLWDLLVCKRDGRIWLDGLGSWDFMGSENPAVVRYMRLQQTIIPFYPFAVGSKQLWLTIEPNLKPQSASQSTELNSSIPKLIASRRQTSNQTPIATWSACWPDTKAKAKSCNRNHDNNNLNLINCQLGWACCFLEWMNECQVTPPPCTRPNAAHLLLGNECD